LDLAIDTSKKVTLSDNPEQLNNFKVFDQALPKGFTHDPERKGIKSAAVLSAAPEGYS
jgi:hypothetical protein